MPNIFQQFVQAALAAPSKSDRCRRRACVRARRCLPPREEECDAVSFICPHEPEEEWAAEKQILCFHLEHVASY